MAEYNTVNAKLSNSQLSELKSAVKNKQGTTLRMNARMFNETNLPHELLLTTRQTTKLRNAIENSMSTDIKLSKVQISKIIQSGGFLEIIQSLLKTGLPLSKSVIKPLGEDSNILLKGVTKTIKNETKEQKGGFLSMLLGTLGASLLGDLLTKNLSGKGTVRAGEGTIRAGEGITKKALMAGNFSLKNSPHPLTNFEIKNYYENEPRFNGVCSRDNLSKTIKNGAYVINLNEYADVGTHWIALYVKDNEISYFNSFGVEHVPKEIEKFIGHKNVKTNICRIQADNSIMRGYFCIKFIDFMFAGRSLIDFSSLFSPYDFKKNDDVILSYFK